MKRKEVSFVIPARNMEHCIEKCLKSIVEQDYKEKINIVVVDDGSKDNTAFIVGKFSKQLNKKNRKIFLLSRKFGKKGRKVFAVNYGLKFVIAKLKSEVVAVLDADTFIQKKALTRMVPKLENAMCVISPIVPYNRKKFLSKLQVIEYVLTFFFRELLGRVNALCIAPAFSIFRTEFFIKHGLYDARTLTEDFEIALRVKAKGYNIAFVNLKAYTMVPTTWSELKRQRVRWGYGTIENFVKYKKLVSPKYGLLGTFFLPVTLVLGLFILVLSLFLLIYNFVASSWNFFHYLFLGWRPELKLEFNFFKISLFFADPKIILIIFSIILSIFYLIYAYKHQKERINLFYYFIFLFGYSFFLAYTQLEAFIRWLFKIKTEW